MTLPSRRSSVEPRSARSRSPARFATFLGEPVTPRLRLRHASDRPWFPCLVLVVVCGDRRVPAHLGAADRVDRRTVPSAARPDPRPLRSRRPGLLPARCKSERGRLDRYVASLNVPADDLCRLVPRAADGLLAERLQRVRPADGRRTTIPIRGKSAEYPAGSIRQIPGAFDKTQAPRRRTLVTLDEIEKTVLPEFKEPRLFLALGRGAVGSGRLRSEAFSADRLESSSTPSPRLHDPGADDQDRSRRQARSR